MHYYNIFICYKAFKVWFFRTFMKFCRDRCGNSNVRIITTFRNIGVLKIAFYILTVTSASFVTSSPYVQEPASGPFFEPNKSSHISFKIRGYVIYSFLRSIWQVWVKREMHTGFWFRKLKEKDDPEELGVVETIILKCISKKYGRGFDSACNRIEY